MNSINLIGRLVRDPELSKTPTGTSFSRFTVAVSAGQDHTNFIPCVTWEAQAENLVKFQKKGNQVSVMGELTVRNYDDAQGNKRTYTEVLARRVNYLDSKSADPKPAPMQPGYAKPQADHLPEPAPEDTSLKNAQSVSDWMNNI